MNQTGKRRVVVVIRERGGKSLPGVFRTEAEAMNFIRTSVVPQTTLYADEASSWNELHARFIGKFIDWRIEHNRLPVDIEAIEAAYKNWIRDEATRFAGGHNPSRNDVVGGSPKRSNPSDLVLSALNRART
jgi:hypothetical protein